MAAGSKLEYRLRRWPSFDPELGQRLVFAGSVSEIHIATLNPLTCKRY